MRLPRMTIRRWMVAAAGMALGLWGWGVARRSPQYRERAAALKIREDLAFETLEIDTHLGEESARTERLRQSTLYYRMLRQKYERAARYPWLPVEPDPRPEP